jgi:hypothetical protein
MERKPSFGVKIGSTQFFAGTGAGTAEIVGVDAAGAWARRERALPPKTAQRASGTSSGTE